MSDESPVTTTFWPGHPLSYATTRIGLFYNDQFLSSATGFVLHVGPLYSLVTNWHVVSGIHPITGACISKMGGLPNRISFHVAAFTPTEAGEERLGAMYFRPIELDLHAKDGSPIWFDEKEPGVQNDYAVIPLNQHVPELRDGVSRLRCIDGGKVTIKRRLEGLPEEGMVRVQDIAHFYPRIGSEVFVIGYPLGISSNGIFPIWKRASIASEPQTGVTLSGRNYDNAFYVDAMTKAGMSGSPVVYLGRTGDKLYSDDGIVVEQREDEPLMVGVYAGRDGVSQDEYELSVGRVWKIGSVEALVMKHHARYELA
ncbi:trypsin-like peptidase domain-containing protein [Mesorhizobium sp. M0323]|uniref:trypsin-like peptidase domain-containing protein n=1 Tax=Mesorhizobium sp. M0323 TaxID=2956938 RepID=UPI00333995A5